MKFPSQSRTDELQPIALQRAVAGGDFAPTGRLHVAVRIAALQPGWGGQRRRGIVVGDIAFVEETASRRPRFLPVKTKDGVTEMIERSIRVARVSACRTCLELFEMACRQQPDVELVYACERSNGWQENVLDLKPEIILLDVDCTVEIFELARELRSRSNTTKLVLVIATVSESVIRQVLAVKPHGCLMKEQRIQELLKDVQRVASGEHRFARPIEKLITFDHTLRRFITRRPTPADRLTSRQLEIVGHLARGDSAKMAARKLNLAWKTVSNHKYRIMQTLGLRNQVELTRFAIREGLIEP